MTLTSDLFDVAFGKKTGKPGKPNMNKLERLCGSNDGQVSTGTVEA